MKLLSIFLALTGVVIIVAMASIYVPRWLAPPVGKTEQVIITNKGAYRIQGYERFYDLQEEVQSIDIKLQAYPTVLEGRQPTQCIGLLARRADTVRTYNQRARAVETTGKWLADNLPTQLQHYNIREC